MLRLVPVLRRFARDERGVFAVLFGLMAIVLIAMGGAVVDYVSLEQTRSRAQTALDAAALALQPEIFKSTFNAETVRQQAEAIVLERIGDTEVDASVDDIEVNIADGSLYLRAEFTIPTMFVSLVGVNTLSAAVQSEATRKMLELEVAMVLDNSGSMGSYSRMTYLKQAAACATRTIFYGKVDSNCNVASGTPKLDKVKIGIVPFTIMVNVGTQFANAAWLDWTAQGALAKLNFDNDDDSTNAFPGPVDRKNLFTQTGTSWRGCVEARQAPYDTNDTPPTTAATKFIPMFSPDTATGNYNSYLSDTGGTCQVKTCTQKVVQNNCTYWWGGYSCSGPTITSYTKVVGSVTTTPGTSCIPSSPVTLSGPSTSTSGSSRTTTTTYSLLTERELQERLCKYNGVAVSDRSTSGPNANCPYVEILPLTSDDTAVLNRINTMNADGGTNIQQGAMWGYHALSNAEPLTQAAPYSSGAVSKVMILMTDGFNEPDYRRYSDTWNGTAIYGSWGFRKDGRLPDTDGIIGNENEYGAHNSKADMTVTMDQKTVQTCANAKADGIRVYTIGLNPPSQATRDMLTSCSSGDGYYFFPNNPSELVDVFAQIANQLTQLRLAL
ncbi:pilus assembly protein [Devosia sp. PTR5]|uniref:Pilus assembly protein n=1 Tax=Devosia oryzisoli TaxID=2774138 RepID=A0A927IT99_9HYPH|nr:TadE/TadG family type IV pilus assembly protein [Devosia oryzisoli]MBD8065583.1 pilus assembly protein [Devosia oryzisoli]